MEPLAYAEMAQFEDRHWWFRGRRTIIDSVLSRLPLSDNADILEVGCGSGGNFATLSRYGRLWAGEMDEGMRHRAERRGIAKDIQGCVLPAEFPFDDRRFDLIALLDVLEHIEDDAGSLRVLRRHLQDDRYLLITVPMHMWLWSSHDTYNHHFRRYSRDELLGRVENAGLEVTFQSYFNTWLFPAVAAARLLGRWTGRSEGGDLSMPAPWLNELLYRLFASERYVLPARIPLGVSYLVVARPPVPVHGQLI